MRLSVIDEFLIPKDDEAKLVFGKAYGIGRFVEGELTKEQLLQETPTPIDEQLIYGKSEVVIKGLAKASIEFSFAGHDSLGSEVARIWGIETWRATAYLSEIALLSLGELERVARGH